MLVLSNTTPLIALAGINSLELLHQLYGSIIIPPAVKAELIGEPEKSAVTNSPWIVVKQPISHEERKRDFRARLHAGEVEVMILAEELGADLVIMDDYAAKKTAKFMGMKTTGTLGILIQAKRRGLIQEVKPLMEAVISQGLYVSEKIQRLVLREAGEN